MSAQYDWQDQPPLLEGLNTGSQQAPCLPAESRAYSSPPQPVIFNSAPEHRRASRSRPDLVSPSPSRPNSAGFLWSPNGGGLIGIGAFSNISGYDTAACDRGPASNERNDFHSHNFLNSFGTATATTATSYAKSTYTPGAVGDAASAAHSAAVGYQHNSGLPNAWGRTYVNSESYTPGYTPGYSSGGEMSVKSRLYDAAKPRDHRKRHSRIAAPIGEIDSPDPSSTYSDNGMMSPLTLSTAESTPNIDAYGPSFAGQRPQLCTMPPTPDSKHDQLDSLQNMLVMLAHKERRVLEAAEILAEAQDDLHQFRRRVNMVLGRRGKKPMPKLLLRRMRSHLGIAAVSYTDAPDPIVPLHPWGLDADSNSTQDCPKSPPASWPTKIFGGKNRGTAAIYRGDGKKPAGPSNLSFSLRIVNYLLEIVHSIITVLPTYQAQQGQQIWRPRYPSPTETLYTLMAYEA